MRMTIIITFIIIRKLVSFETNVGMVFSEGPKVKGANDNDYHSHLYLTICIIK